MKPEFQAKFLQHLNKKKQQEEGFTLIELLVVIIIIGILAAIALPSLLGQVAKAKQAEAKNNVGALNRAQQAYFLEWQDFTTGLTDLGIGIKTQTENYTYTIKRSTGSTGSIINNMAVANKSALRSYSGIVGTTVGDTITSEALTVAFACESKLPTKDAPAEATSLAGCNVINYKDLSTAKNTTQ